MNSTCTCGCCEGIAIAVPQSTANRPGLPALAYRVGTHATFLETMIARLSSQDFPALAALKTRDPADPSIALLDSWALVADVLTFYQERIANEGYLRTATERRSILELARLIGYRLRPGVAATVYLAYTLDEDHSKTPPIPTETLIPAGSRSQSVPGPGQMPQSFETAEDLDARSEWSNLKPRLTRPQVITLPQTPRRGTDADIIDTLYFDGISTNLKTGDALLIVLGNKLSNNSNQQFLRFVESVDVQADQSRTEATLQEPTRVDPTNVQGETVGQAVMDDLQRFLDDATNLFPGSALAGEVAALLKQPAGSQTPPGLFDLIQTSVGSGATVAGLIRQVLPKVQELLDLATKRNFTRLKPWIADLRDTLNTIIQDIENPVATGPNSAAAPAGQAGLKPLASAPTLTPMANIGSVMSALSQPPSLQPPNSLQLPRSIAGTFSTQSDIAPKLLRAFHPAASDLIYAALDNQEPPNNPVEIYAFRVKAALFASGFAGAAIMTPAGSQTPAAGTIAAVTSAVGFTTTFTPPNLHSGALNQTDGTLLALDAVYEKILPGSWVAIQYPDIDAQTKQPKISISFHKVVGTQILSIQAMDQSTKSPTPQGFTAKVTQLKLDPPPTVIDVGLNNPTDSLRQTVVAAQAEILDLTEEPLDIDIDGDTIELDGVYDGLESGRWIIVSGERTDIVDASGASNITGITASELVMLAGVTQGAQAHGCIPFPDLGVPYPLSSVDYITNADSSGDRFVIGKPYADRGALAKRLPRPTRVNQEFCDLVQLAAGVWLKAYVPTDKEISGNILQLPDLLADTAEQQRLLLADLEKGSLWAWRISTPKAKTILTLANKLAYSYDINTVTIYGNVVKATHGETRNETLGNGDTSQSFQQFALKQKPLTFVPASNPDGVGTTLAVYVNNVEWQETDTLAGLGPKDRSYVTDAADDDTTSVTFGNGVEGARLPTGVGNITAIYRNGIGQPGNVDANQISLLQSRPLNAKAVINPLRASGGADRDSRDQARRNAPLAVMSLDRLVSVEDYADFARTFAGIGKASSTRISDGRRDLVHVTVAGAEDIPIDYSSDLYANLVQALQINGDPYLPLQVAIRRLRLIVISATVKILPDYLWEPVATAVRSALANTFGFDNRDLGQPVFRSEVISVMQGVAGVAYVDLHIFDSVPEDYTAAQLADLANLLKLREYIPAALARPNPNPVNYPTDSIFAAELVYLTSAIPDTLILNQVKS